MSKQGPKYDLRQVKIGVVDDLCKKWHGYGGAGKVYVYAFAVFEDDVAVAAYVWQPPPPGAAKAVSPGATGGALSLSRMVACPRDQRRLNHVSKPLRRQMRTLIDRGRWPVLVTYSDEGQGHTGHTYKCSGWTPTVKSKRRVVTTKEGVRVSRYSNGVMVDRSDCIKSQTVIQRWEHRVCEKGQERAHMERSGWVYTPIAGKFWRSGSQAHKWVKTTERDNGER